MQTIGTVLFVGLVLAGFVCWGTVVYNMFRAVVLRKPGVDLWRGTMLNPFNLLLQPDKLSEAGNVARRRCIIGVLGFLASVVLGALVALVTGIGA